MCPREDYKERNIIQLSNLKQIIKITYTLTSYISETGGMIEFHCSCIMLNYLLLDIKRTQMSFLIRFHTNKSSEKR